LNLWQEHENERRGSDLVQTPIATAIIIGGSPLKSADTGRHFDTYRSALSMGAKSSSSPSQPDMGFGRRLYSPFIRYSLPV
jgi:hypothetical protein